MEENLLEQLAQTRDKYNALVNGVNLLRLKISKYSTPAYYISDDAVNEMKNDLIEDINRLLM